MSLGVAIVLGGWGYAIACRLSDKVTELGITRGRRMGLACTVLGVFVDVVLLK